MELAHVLAGVEVEELQEWHAELASTAADLAARAGALWPVGRDDSTVGLVRIIAWVAATAPQVRSDLAAQLIEALELRRT